MDLTGKLLVAQPTCRSRDREGSVLFVYEQTKNFASAICVNKETDRTVGELAAYEGYDYSGDDVLYCGGPSNPTALVMLHSLDWECDNTYQITDDICISSDPTMLQRICDGDTPTQWKLFMGMYTWKKGELANELEEPDSSAWIYGDATSHIVFSQDEERQYKWAIKSCSRFMTDQYFKI